MAETALISRVIASYLSPAFLQRCCCAAGDHVVSAHQQTWRQPSKLAADPVVSPTSLPFAPGTNERIVAMRWKRHFQLEILVAVSCEGDCLTVRAYCRRADETGKRFLWPSIQWYPPVCRLSIVGHSEYYGLAVR